MKLLGAFDECIPRLSIIFQIFFTLRPVSILVTSTPETPHPSKGPLLVVSSNTFFLHSHDSIRFNQIALMVENKYLEKSGIETRLEFLRTLGIMYSADNKYDIQLETIINAWTLITGKILMLMCLRNFTSRSFV